jgi:hypothetical protein
MHKILAALGPKNPLNGTKSCKVSDHDRTPDGLSIKVQSQEVVLHLKKKSVASAVTANEKNFFVSSPGFPYP